VAVAGVVPIEARGGGEVRRVGSSGGEGANISLGGGGATTIYCSVSSLTIETMDILTLCFTVLCSPAPGRGGTLALFALQNVNNLSRASFSALFESLLTECENVSRMRCSSHGTVSYWISYSPKYKQGKLTSDTANHPFFGLRCRNTTASLSSAFCQACHGRKLTSPVLAPFSEYTLRNSATLASISRSTSLFGQYTCGN